MYTVRFTADLIIPNDTDTDCYGEPCEPGCGYSVQSGWWAPRFTTYAVSEDRDYADTFTYAGDDIDLSPPAWLVHTLSEYLPGGIELGSAPSFCANGTLENHTTGESVRPAGHADGFTDAELNTAIALLTNLEMHHVHVQ